MFIEVKNNNDLRVFINVREIAAIEETPGDRCTIYFKNDAHTLHSVDSYNSIKMKIQAST